MWNDLKEAVRTGMRLARWVLAGALVLYLLSGFYVVRQNQIGVVAFLGKVGPERAGPGLHYCPPPPLGKVWKLPARESKRILIDDYAPEGAGAAELFARLTGLDSYLLTGDNNAVNIEIVLQYTVSDPYLRLTGTAAGDALLREIVCRETLRAMASRGVDDVLTTGKKEIENVIRTRAQERLDYNRAGLAISSVEIKEVQPPPVVQAFFTDVINAQVEMKGMLSGAESYRNEIIPRSRGEAERQIKEAQSHRDRVVKAARGESDRFLKNLSELAKAPDVGRARLYLEFARDSLSRAGDIHVLDTAAGAPPARLRLFPRE